MYEFCRRYTGGSLSAACHMNQGLADVTVNWAGGLHHSKKAEASGESSKGAFRIDGLRGRIFHSGATKKNAERSNHRYEKAYLNCDCNMILFCFRILLCE